MKNVVNISTFLDNNLPNLQAEIFALKQVISQISDENKNLSSAINKKDCEIKEKDSQLAKKEEKHQQEIKSKDFEILYYKKLVFGKRSEKSKYLTNDQHNQLSLFDEIDRYETEDKEIKKEQELTNEVKAILDEKNRLKSLELEYKKKQQELSGKKKGRKLFKDSNPNIKVERKEIDIEESQKQCHCGNCLTKIGEETSETIEYIQATIKIVENVRFKYACKACEENVKIAKKANKVFDKTSASSSLLSHILVSKFEDHLPFYRQSKIFKRHNLNIDRKLMNNWLFKSAKLFAPLFMELKNEIKESNYLAIDETPLNTIDKSKTNKAYMWLYHSKEKDKKLLYYDFCLDRSSHNPKLLLGSKQYQSYIQTDGYSGYNFLNNDKKITRIGCMAHARRKFYDIAQLIKIEDATNQENIIAHHALNEINKLYLIEKRIRVERIEDAKEINQIRQNEAKPILEKLHDYIKQQEEKILNNSPIHKAVIYFLNQYQYLKNYLKDPQIDIDNNKTENAIRPFALGRKNWLFVGDEQGGVAAGTIYSLIESAKINNLHTQKYLKYLFDNIKEDISENQLKEFLPNRVDREVVNGWV